MVSESVEDVFCFLTTILSAQTEAVPIICLDPSFLVTNTKQLDFIIHCTCVGFFIRMS